MLGRLALMSQYLTQVLLRIIKELLNELKTISKDGVQGFDDDSNGYVDDADGWDFIDNDNNHMTLKGMGHKLLESFQVTRWSGYSGISPNAHKTIKSFKS